METRGKRKALSCAHLVFTLLTDTKMKKCKSDVKRRVGWEGGGVAEPMTMMLCYHTLVVKMIRGGKEINEAWACLCSRHDTEHPSETQRLQDRGSIKARC